MKAALRPLRGALAIWQVLLLLALQLSDGSGAHGCPTHDRVAPATGHAGHAGHHAAGTDAGDTHGHGGPCTCIGACNGTSLAGAPSRAAALDAPATAPYSVPMDFRAAPSRVAPRLLPFAVGPPARA